MGEWDMPRDELSALKVKENWFNQLVEWLRVFHPKEYEDFQKHVMGIGKIENAPMAIGPPPVVTVSARPEAIDEALTGGHE